MPINQFKKVILTSPCPPTFTAFGANGEKMKCMNQTDKKIQQARKAQVARMAENI